MPSAIAIGDQDVLLAIDLQADFMPGGALAVDDGDAVVPRRQCAHAPFRQCRRDAGLAPAGPCLVRLYPRRRAVRHEAPRITATRRCGRTIASRELRARTLHPGLDADLRIPHPAQGHAPRRRFLFGLRRGGRQDDDGACRAAASARGKRVFACGLATDYCVAFSALDAREAGFETLRHRGRLPGDRRQRVARRRLGADERCGGLAHPVREILSLSPSH